MNSSTTFRIATWNLERPRKNGLIKNQHRLDKIHEIGTDVWVLTETNAAINLQSDYESVTSSALEYHRPGENLTTIWSRWKRKA